MVPEIRRRRSRSRVHRWARRLRKRIRNSPILIAVLCLFGLALLWSTWLMWSTRQDLAHAQERAEVLRAALVRGDAETARSAMKEYQDAVESAESHTSGPFWWAFQRVPFLGDDAKSVAVVSEVLADIGRDGLPPIVEAADAVTADAFQPVDGTFPLEQIRRLEEPARRSEQAFDQAAEDLAVTDDYRLLGPVRTQVTRLSDLVLEARSTLGSTYRAARMLPSLLGEEEPRFYLLVLQNNAELRSGGGLPGALSLIRAHRGNVEIVEQVDTADLGRGRTPVVPLTDEERRVFGNRLASYPVDATLTPDVPRAAAILNAHWQRVVGRRIDGVVFVDPVAISYLLRGVGAVNVPGFVQVDAGNVVATVENQVYLTSADREVHSDFQQAVAKSVFDAFAAGQGSSVTSIQGLVDGVREGRVRVHSFLADDQAEIAGTDIAGEFTDPPGDAPTVGVYVNDAGPTKMQFYLRYDGRLFSRACLDDRQEIGGSIEFHSDTPPDVSALPPSITGADFPGVRVAPGDQLLVVYLTSPVAGEILELSIDGQRIAQPVIEELAGRELARVGVRLEPDARHRVDFVMRAGPGQTGDIELSVTPGAAPGSPNAVTASSCTIR